MRKLAPLAALLAVALGAWLAWWLVGSAAEAPPPPHAKTNPSAGNEEAAIEPDRGRARVTRHETARAGARADASTSPEDEGPTERLHVIVECVDGTPCADVALHLFSIRSEDAWDSQIERTDDAGRASFPRQPFQSAVLRVALPLVESHETKIAPDRDWTQPVHVVIPATGRVVCDLVDASGAAVTSPRPVAMRRAEDDYGRVPLPEDKDSDVVFVSARDGVAVFPFVEAGLELVLFAASPDGTEVTARAAVRGPDAPGAEVRVRLVVCEARPVVTGRLVAADGAPIVGARVFGDVLTPGERWYSWHHQAWSDTDDSGRFSLALDVPRSQAAGNPLRIGRQLLTDPAAGGSWESMELAVRDLPRALSGSFDVGDVISTDVELLAEGTVVNHAGKPVAGAAVTAMGARYRMGDTPSVTTDEHGAFRLVGRPPAEDIGIAVEADGYWLESHVRVPVGTPGVQVRLSPAALLRGNVLPIEGFDVGTLRVFLRGEPALAGGPRSVNPRGLSLHLRDGKFEWLRARPGTGSMVIQSDWDVTTELLVIDNLRFVAGRAVDDSRLRDIDLSAFVQPSTIRVRDESGDPVTKAVVHYRAADVGNDATWADVNVTDEGVATLLSTAPRTAVMVVAPGYHTVTRAIANGDTEITLARVPMTEVTIAVREDSPYPAPPYHLTAELVWFGPLGDQGGDEDGDPWWADPRGIDGFDDDFGADRSTTISAWEPGRYYVELVLWRSEVDGATGEDIHCAPQPCIVEVLGDGKPIRIETGIDPKEFASRMKESD